MQLYILNMHNIISVIIVILIVIILLKAVGKRKQRRPSYTKPRQPTYSMHQENSLYDLGCGGRKVACPDDLHASVMGLHEVEQNTRMRGYVPHANQPNHVSNLWKCDQSQCTQDDMMMRNDYMTDTAPVRAPSGADAQDSSNMHITSRFATVPSK